MKRGGLEACAVALSPWIVVQIGGMLLPAPIRASDAWRIALTIAAGLTIVLIIRELVLTWRERAARRRARKAHRQPPHPPGWDDQHPGVEPPDEWEIRRWD